MFTSIESNSPLRTVPDDYVPDGTARWFSIPEGPDAGKTMFYFDHVEGDATPAATVLFVHGNPECSYTYRHVRRHLATAREPVRIVAMDHVGFGLSDQATFEMVDLHHANNLAQLVRALDLRDVTLVVHDWGGPIGIGALAGEHERVRNLVVLNTTIFPMPPDGLTYENFPVAWMPWCRTPRLVPDALWGGVAARVVSHGEPQGTARFMAGVAAYLIKYGRGSFADGTPEAVWSGQMRSRANARSSKRNVLQTPRWGHGYRYRDPTLGDQDNHAFYRNMQGTVGREWGAAGRNIDVAGHFGSWDPCGKESVIGQWQDALPRMLDRTHIYPENGHFIEEYRGREIARSIFEMNGLSCETV